VRGIGRLSGRLAELLKGERPIRNLVGRLLWQTGLCRRFTIRKNGYVLRFFPSSVSCAYWIDPDARADGAIAEFG
jgi:hypothetical protein